VAPLDASGRPGAAGGRRRGPGDVDDPAALGGGRLPHRRLGARRVDGTPPLGRRVARAADGGRRGRVRGPRLGLRPLHARHRRRRDDRGGGAVRGPRHAVADRSDRSPPAGRPRPAVHLDQRRRRPRLRGRRDRGRPRDVPLPRPRRPRERGLDGRPRLVRPGPRTRRRLRRRGGGVPHDRRADRAWDPLPAHESRLPATRGRAPTARGDEPWGADVGCLHRPPAVAPGAHQPRPRRPRRRLRREHRVRQGLPQAPRGRVGDRRRRRLCRRSAGDGPPRGGGRRAPGHRGRQRLRLHDARRPCLPRRLPRRRQLLRDREPRGLRRGDAQVRVPLPRAPGGPLPGRPRRLPRPLAHPPPRRLLLSRPRLQGLDDHVCPPRRPSASSPRWRRRDPARYLAFEGEDHGFRQAANIVRSLQAELAFYGGVFGFTPADELPALPWRGAPREPSARHDRRPAARATLAAP